MRETRFIIMSRRAALIRALDGYTNMLGRNHWESRIKPLPKKRHKLPFKRSFNPTEISLLRQGLLPQTQDDRWIVLLHEKSLDIYRSWTGHCIYSLLLKPLGSGFEVEEILEAVS